MSVLIYYCHYWHIASACLSIFWMNVLVWGSQKRLHAGDATWTKSLKQKSTTGTHPPYYIFFPNSSQTPNVHVALTLEPGVMYWLPFLLAGKLTASDDNHNVLNFECHLVVGKGNYLTHFLSPLWDSISNLLSSFYYLSVLMVCLVLVRNPFKNISFNCISLHLSFPTLPYHRKSFFFCFSALSLKICQLWCFCVKAKLDKIR